MAARGVSRVRARRGAVPGSAPRAATYVLVDQRQDGERRELARFGDERQARAALEQLRGAGATTAAVEVATTGSGPCPSH